VCITRVGKVLTVSEGTATVRFFDGRESESVDISFLRGVKRGTYVEVYGNLALSILSVLEAKSKLKAWEEVRKAAMLPSLRHGDSS